MQRVSPNISGAKDQSPKQSWPMAGNLRINLVLPDVDKLQAANALIAELQAENDRLRAASSRDTRLQAENDRLKAEVERLRAASSQDAGLQAKNDRLMAELQAKLDEARKIIEALHVKYGQPAADDTNSGIPGSKVQGGRRRTGKSGPAGDGKPKRPRGRPKGHKGSNRKPAPPENVDESVAYEPKSTDCPKCGTPMIRKQDLDTIFQQIEKLKEITRIVEARGAAYTCPCCATKVNGTVPTEIRNRPLLGPQLLAFVIALRFCCNASIRAISKFLNDTTKQYVSIGCLTKSIIRGSECLAENHKEIEDQIRLQPVVYIDETPHLDDGRRCYTWVFVTDKAILFAIGNRSLDMVNRVLGPDYEGIICSDYYGVYISYVKSNNKVKHQACLAHLKREFKRCAEHVFDREISQYGEKMLKLLDDLFKVRDEFNADKTPEALARFRQAAEVFNREGALAPNKGQPARLAKRFVSGDAYTTFVSEPVDATNNRSERAIRKVVILRSVTQGTRGENGRLASERFWSVKATCELQNRSFVDYFGKCYEAHLKGEPTPSIFSQQ
jgi:hypothetical protein